MAIDLEQLEQFARERYIPVILDDSRELLFNLVRERAPKRILEIGTAIGYSGIIMLSASPLATLNTIELDEATANLARKNFAKAEVLERVNLFVGDAREIVRMLSGQYDFIFMDGPKGQYEVFLPYLTDLLEVGGMLLCDNVLYKGLVEHIPHKRHKHITVARNMNAFLQDITTSDRYQTVVYRNVGDGLSASVKLK